MDITCDISTGQYQNLETPILYRNIALPHAKLLNLVSDQPAQMAQKVLRKS
jgi:hypothetical protein